MAVIDSIVRILAVLVVLEVGMEAVGFFFLFLTVLALTKIFGVVL